MILVDCLICGRDHPPTHLICGDCYGLVDREVRIEESETRQKVLSRLKGRVPALEARSSMVSDPAYLPVARKVYAQALSRVREMFSAM